MAKYINRDTLTAELHRLGFGEHGFVERILADGAYSVIESMPTADVAPVVHGRWEWFDEETGTPIDGYEREWGWRCSCCNIELPDDYDNPDIHPEMKYCHNCGARMDEPDESEN